MSTPVFVECQRCGERWKIATLPEEISKIARAAKHVFCPNCGAKSDRIGMCPTEGPNAVTESRNGKAQVRP